MRFCAKTGAFSGKTRPIGRESPSKMAEKDASGPRFSSAK
jgi:hypothetical protein